MKRRGMALAALITLSGVLGGCGYSGIATAGDAAVITRNDWFLFGALRKVYVCKITATGLTQCSSQESP